MKYILLIIFLTVCHLKSFLKILDLSWAKGGYVPVSNCGSQRADANDLHHRRTDELFTERAERWQVVETSEACIRCKSSHTHWQSISWQQPSRVWTCFAAQELCTLYGCLFCGILKTCWTFFYDKGIRMFCCSHYAMRSDLAIMHWNENVMRSSTSYRYCKKLWTMRMECVLSRSLWRPFWTV